MGLENENDIVFSMMNDNTAKLTSAVNSLPQLLERKRLIDMHTTIATGEVLQYENWNVSYNSSEKFRYNFVSYVLAVLNTIKSRRLDTLFEFEEKIMSKTSLDRSIIDIIDDPEYGTEEDKMRVFLIYYICSQNLSTV